jgi:hypothetical protein
VCSTFKLTIASRNRSYRMKFTAIFVICLFAAHTVLALPLVKRQFAPFIPSPYFYSRWYNGNIFPYQLAFPVRGTGLSYDDAKMMRTNTALFDKYGFGRGRFLNNGNGR